MKNTFHILNGDALHERIKNLFHDEFIICREALIEGPLDKNNFNIHRAAFHQVSLKEYKEISLSQIDAIKSIPSSSDINLWFEDDLFCQTNLWFIVDLIISMPLKANVYLVRPTTESWTGFGYMDEKEFKQAYENKVLLSTNQLSFFQKLWKIYSKEIEGDLMHEAKELQVVIPRMLAVIQAQLDREEPLNKPFQSLKKIFDESNDKSFKAIFTIFSQQNGIYGFGDTSVKKMYDRLRDQS